MCETLLEVKNVSISFDQYGRGLKRFRSEPIKELNLKIKRGEIVAIVGASGSGKSLLAHAIMDILPPNAKVEGDIYYKGQILNKGNIVKYRGKEIEFIPQSINYLDPTMKVKNQIKIGLQGNKEKKTKIQEELLKKFHLKTSVGELYPFQLSGGMLRRVLFATSIRDEIELIIADEPTPGIHKDALALVLKELRKLADEGKGIMLITHDLISAVEIADAITVFSNGRTLNTVSSDLFKGNGESLEEPYTRKLWQSLPENAFWEVV